MDNAAEDLNALLFRAEAAIDAGDVDDAIASATQFAEIVLQMPPFAPRGALPQAWRDILSDWLHGRLMAEIVAPDPERSVEFIENVIVYRLVWAAEAVVYVPKRHQDDYSGLWSGKLAAALEAGTLDQQAVILIQAGLGSRIAAFRALSDFPAEFRDFDGMREWLFWEPVSDAGKLADWPTPETADLWHAFVRASEGELVYEWKIQTKAFPVRWNSTTENAPNPGTLVRVVNRSPGTSTQISAPDFVPLGELTSRVRISSTGIVYGAVAAHGDKVEVTYIGPDELR